MSIPSSLRPRLNFPTAFWTVSLGLLLALAGFAGLLSLSFLEPAPIRELVDVSRQVQQARSASLSDAAAAALDDAAAQLYAAQRAVAAEEKKSWRLRSYDRARALIQRAGRNLAAATRTAADPASPPA